MEQPLAQLGRAGPRVGAADVGVALALGAQRGAAAPTGQCVGITNGRAPSGCSPSGPRTGPRISGMTSPALRSTTVSPIEDALADDLLRRCAGWPCSTVDPATLTGSITRERRDPAGAADVDLDVEQGGGDLLRRVLEGDRPPRRAAGAAEPALHRDLVDLDHQAVDLVLGHLVPVLARRTRCARGPRPWCRPRRRGRRWAGPRRAAARRPATGARGRSPSAPRCRARPSSAAGSR